jgi:hypothetical protein
MVAATLAYPGTWMIHHLACVAEAGEPGPVHLAEIGALMRAPIQGVEISDARFFLIYLERHKRLNERLYEDFRDSYQDPDRLLLTPFTVLRRRTDAPADPSASIAVWPASPARLQQLAGRLRENTPLLVRQALGLEEDALDLRAFSASCAGQGHERRREVFFAEPDGERGAALLADSGSEGTNVFNLLNTCHIVPLGPSAPSPAVCRALLARANAHYAALGKRTFLLFEDGVQASTSTALALGFEHVSAGLRWIAHREVIPSFDGYLRTMLPATDPGAFRSEEPALLRQALAGE